MTTHAHSTTDHLPESEPMTGEAHPRAAETHTRLTLRSGSVAETQRLGERIGRQLRAGDVVLLTGDLGAGKTALAQGIGRGLGVTQTINSPTFTILKEYEGRLPLYHFDLYRIDDPDELLALGFDRYFEGDGVCVVEWAERAEAEGTSAAPWPEDALRVTIRREGAHGRALRFEAGGARSLALANELALSIMSGQVE
jgi:tRNA threonylcarbamoyladenosine biosynthesis protein TsaE